MMYARSFQVPLIYCLLPLAAAWLFFPRIASAAEAEPAQGAETKRQLTPEQMKFFEEKVRPILVNNCQKCHGEKDQKGNLRLDSLTSLLTGGDSGPAVVPGKPDESLLVEAVNWDSYEMPPGGKMKETEIAVLTNWVKHGAFWPGQDGSGPKIRKKEKITEEDRNWWAFQPVRDVPPPAVDDGGWSQTGIDRFIFRKLHEAGLEPAPPATKERLIRRVYFTLWGLPPSPQEVDAFVRDNSPKAYEKLIDRLLDSPRYGEHWARHWLDLVRYAESDGFRQDAFRPRAWRYRDYVIRAFNADKPYDRFVLEQLAGDEVAPGDPDAITATAYYRHGIYEHNQRDARTQWDDIITDITNTTGDVFLGLGMGCARCHDHKFDPILQKDYLRLRAFFEPILPREDVRLPSNDPEYLAKLKKWKALTSDIRAEMRKIQGPDYPRPKDRGAVNKFPEDIQAIMRKPYEERTPHDHQLAYLVMRQSGIADPPIAKQHKARYEELEKELAKFDKYKPAPRPTVLTVTDVGPEAPPTVMPKDRRKQSIPPGFLTVFDPEPAHIDPVPTAPNSTGRRTALARWIGDPKNPLTTRVIANRIWHYHFGRGLVPTVSDFGRLGEPPSHPELLDYLTRRFVEDGWSFKNLHRRILLSATYRQSALRPTPSIAAKADPENHLLWKMNGRRLQAEQIRDAMLAVSGELDLKEGGPSVKPSTPRRSIYTKVIRNTPDELLRLFDAPDTFASIGRRNVTTTPTQSLLMINGDWTLKRAKALAARLSRTDAANPGEIIRRAYRLAYAREPSEAELTTAIAFLAGHAIRPPENAKRETPSSDVPLGRFSKEYGTALRRSQSDRLLQLPASDRLPDVDFTVEASVKLNSLYPDATVRTIVSHWDSNTRSPGWSLGVTSTKSKYTPRNLILQLVGDDPSGKRVYEVIPSGLHLELGKAYHVAVSIDIADTSKSGVTFCLKPLDGDGELRTAQVTHRVVARYRSSRPLVIGGRAGSSRHRWDGLLDEVRITRGALPKEQLAGPTRELTKDTVALLRFEEHAPLQDAAAGGGKLTFSKATEGKRQQTSEALVDLCHVLLNSSEFLYID